MSKLHNKGGTAAATLHVFTGGRVAEAAHGARLEGVFHPTAAAPCTKAKAKRQYEKNQEAKRAKLATSPGKVASPTNTKGNPSTAEFKKIPATTGI